MSEFGWTGRDKGSRPVDAETETRSRAVQLPSSHPLVVQREMLDASPRVQSQLALQQLLDRTPGVVAQAKLAEALNGRASVVQRVKGKDSKDGDKKNEDEELTLEEVIALLESSSPEEPLSPEDIARAQRFLDRNLRKLPRRQTGELEDLIREAKRDIKDYRALITSRRPKGQSQTKKKVKVESVHTFDDGNESELSDQESDPDVRLGNYPMSMAPVSGRSHVHGIEEPKPELREYASGLPYADTYLALFKDGSLVPRRINEDPNVEGHRKRMRDVEKKAREAVTERNKWIAQLDALNAQLESGKPKGEELRKLTEQRDQAFQQLKNVLMGQIRPHLEPTLFGSSLRPTSEDIEATKESDTARIELKKKFLADKDLSAAGLLTRGSGAGTETHAEQTLLSTRTWENLIDVLVTAIGDNHDQPEEIEQQSFTSLHLVLNRSTCIGCARELTMELVRFWSRIAEIAGLSDWREAKYIYEDYVDFALSFPAIYEIGQERKNDFENFDQIVLGLRDAGWRVRVSRGISSGKDSDATNKEAAERVAALNAIPAFFATGWSQKIVRFPIPEALAGAAAGGAVLINGILYRKPKDADVLTRDDDVEENSLDAKGIAAFLFLRTGIGSASDGGKQEQMEEEADQSSVKKPLGLSARYKSLLEELTDLPYDEELQQLMLDGYEIRNVSGSGMNCLIRAIYTAAEIDYDETMIKIVRSFLVEQGFALNGNMLDLLDVEGVALIQFMQDQGVLPPGTGITVHFPGDSMQVAPGANQLHLWYAGAHFQAIVPPDQG